MLADNEPRQQQPSKQETPSQGADRPRAIAVRRRRSSASELAVVPHARSRATSPTYGFGDSRFPGLTTRAHALCGLVRRRKHLRDCSLEPCKTSLGFLWGLCVLGSPTVCFYESELPSGRPLQRSLPKTIPQNSGRQGARASESSLARRLEEDGISCSALRYLPKCSLKRQLRAGKACQYLEILANCRLFIPLVSIKSPGRL